MPMIDEPPGPFLMTPAQHREWARILHAKGKPEKARRNEQLARRSRSRWWRPRRGRHGPL
jgi:hypothetical protein